MRRIVLAAALTAVTLSTAACAYGPGPRWCYWHPRRCAVVPPPPPP